MGKLAHGKGLKEGKGSRRAGMGGNSNILGNLSSASSSPHKAVGKSGQITADSVGGLFGAGLHRNTLAGRAKVKGGNEFQCEAKHMLVVAITKKSPGQLGSGALWKMGT